jgi:hypothetical protein
MYKRSPVKIKFMNHNESVFYKYFAWNYWVMIQSKWNIRGEFASQPAYNGACALSAMAHGHSIIYADVQVYSDNIFWTTGTRRLTLYSYDGGGGRARGGAKVLEPALLTTQRAANY